MSRQEQYGHLDEDERLGDANPLQQVDENEMDELDDSNAASGTDMVELQEVEAGSETAAPKKKKKKRVVRVKKRKTNRPAPTEDGVDQAPVNPDDMPPEGENPEDGDPPIYDENENVESHASIVTQILVPVCITMAIVIALVKLLNPPESMGGSSTLYFERAGDSNAKKFGGALLNAAIFVAAMVVVTCIFVVLYKYRCMKIIFGWLGLSTVVLLGGGFGVILWQLVGTLNWTLDWFTFAVVVWNFGLVGMSATFWHAPVKINQMYMIAVSVLMAVLFTRLPEWTTWTILAAIAIYDLFAVLCPRGPLRLLVETAQERNENIPALLYNTIITLMATPSSGPSGGRRRGRGEEISDDENEAGSSSAAASSSSSVTHYNGEDEDDGLIAAPSHSALPGDDEELLNLDGDNQGQHVIPEAQPSSTRTVARYDEDMEPVSSGVKLGLGDFIFYSVLVGRAALFDMLTVFTSFIGIITGLFGTILLLAVWKKALPALPLSILFGVIFFFASRFLLLPFVSTLTMNTVIV